MTRNELNAAVANFLQTGGRIARVTPYLKAPSFIRLSKQPKAKCRPIKQSHRRQRDSSLATIMRRASNYSNNKMLIGA